MREFITACPRNCYSSCTFRVHVEDNSIKRIFPFEGNLATPEGPCIKGQSYIERSKSPDRLTSALAKDKNGSFRKISYDEALEVISSRLTQIKNKYGPHSLLWYRGSGNSGLMNETGSVFWRHWGGATTTFGNLCWPAGLEAVRLTLGDNRHNVPWDIQNAKTIIVWGKNPAETNIQEIALIEKARKNGACLVVIDPRRTPTAEKADIHYRPKPGTDSALALACARLIMDNNLVNKNFIGKYVNGYDTLLEQHLPGPEDVSDICGIPTEDIRNLALLIAKGAPVTFLPGYGLQRYQNGGNTIRSILLLAILTGNIGLKGAGFNYANLQSYIYDNPREPMCYYPDSINDKPFRRSVSMAKLGSDISKLSDPPIKAIWVERGNPLLQVPNTSAVRKAFSMSEFTVVIEQFLTDTALFADIILPAKDIFEQPDIIGSYWSPYIQFKPAILEPAGDVKPESEIYFLLAQKLGMKISEEEIPPPGVQNAEKWLSARISSHSELKIDDLRNGPVIAPGLQQIAYEDMKFPTASGKIELYPSELSSRWFAETAFKYSTGNDSANAGKYPFILMCPNRASSIHSQFGNLTSIRSVVSEAALEISPEDASALLLIDGDEVEVYNDLGSLFTSVRITGCCQEGLVVLHNGIWFSDGGGGNLLSADNETDIGYGAAFHGNRVNIRKRVSI